MKYKVGLFCIIAVGKMVAINLSELLDNGSVQAATTQASQGQKQKPVQAHQRNVEHKNSQKINLGSLVSGATAQSNQKSQQTHADVLHSVMKIDPDYQKALTILSDPHNAQIYQDYLQSIMQFFMDYYLRNIQSVQVVTQKQDNLNLAGLKNMSSGVITQSATQSADVNLSSLMNTETVAHATVGSIQKTGQARQSASNLSALQSTDDLKVTKTQKQDSSVNLAGLKNMNSSVTTQSTTQPAQANLSALMNAGISTNAAVGSIPQTGQAEQSTNNATSLPTTDSLQVTNSATADGAQAAIDGQNKKVIKKKKKKVINLASLLNQSY